MSIILIQTLSSGLVFPLAAMVLGLLRWPVIMNDAFLLSMMQWIGTGLLTGLISSVLMMTVLPQVSDLVGFLLFLLFVSPMGIGFVWLMGTFSAASLVTGSVVAFVSLSLFCALFWLLEGVRKLLNAD